LERGSSVEKAEEWMFCKLEALTMPHRTVVDPEHDQIEALNQALKQAIIRELRS